MRSYFPPPANTIFLLRNAATELYALQCGKQFLAPLEGTFIAESIQSLYQKINANLTPKSRNYLALLRQTVQIGIPPYKVYKAHRSLIEWMKQAIEQGKTAEMEYASFARSTPEASQVERKWPMMLDGRKMRCVLLQHSRWQSKGLDPVNGESTGSPRRDRRTRQVTDIETKNHRFGRPYFLLTRKQEIQYRISL